MKSVGFLILFVINLFGLSCKGQVYPSSDVKTVIPGSNVTLKWTFRADPSKASLAWFFTGRRVCSNKEELLAGKFRNNLVKIESSSLLPPATLVLKDFDERYDGTEYRFNVQAALVLKDVDERYNGKYRFSVQASVGDGEAEVELYIAEKPIVTFTCLSHNEVDEGDNFTCVCKGEKGNPPANVTWYKDSKDRVPIDGIGKENKTLSLINVNETSNGTYKCEARSHTNDSFADKKSIKLIVRQLNKPIKKSTEVSTEKTSTTYTIDFVTPGDAGIYTWIAENKYGIDSTTVSLTVQGPITPTPTISTPTTSQAISSITSSTGTVGPTPTSPPTKGWNYLGLFVLFSVPLIVSLVCRFFFKRKEKFN